MISNDDKTQLIKEINDLMQYDKIKDSISPFVMKYLEIDELLDIRDNLLASRKFLKEESIKWFDELYEKTKKDEL